MARNAQEAKKVAEETTPTVTAPPTAPKRYSRQQALIDTLKTEVTDMEKIIADADALYVKNTGGKSNIEAQKADFDWFVKVMVGIGMAEVKDSNFLLRR